MTASLIRQQAQALTRRRPACNAFGVPVDVHRASVLLIGPAGAGRDRLIPALGQLGRRADAVASGAGALHRLYREPYSLALMLPGLPDITPEALCRMIEEQFHPRARPAVVVLAPGLSDDAAVALYDAGADRLLIDPQPSERIIAAQIEAVLRRVYDLERHGA